MKRIAKHVLIGIAATVLAIGLFIWAEATTIGYHVFEGVLAVLCVAFILFLAYVTCNLN